MYSSLFAKANTGATTTNVHADDTIIPSFYPDDTTLFDELPSPQYSKTFYNECGKGCHPFVRALRSLGWQKVNSLEMGRLVLTFDKIKEEWLEEDSNPLQSWQRYAHLPTTYSWAHNVSAFYELVKDTSLYLPTTYRLDNKEDREVLDKILNHAKKPEDKSAIKTQPWVLQPYNDEADPILIPPKPKLTKDLIEQGALLSKYVCHSMGWGRSAKQKFDVRVYFFVVTLDPLVVVYHDGYVQTSDGPYVEGSYESEDAQDVHLMDFGQFKHHNSKHSFDALEEALNSNKAHRRRPKILRSSSKNNIEITPMQHVRNQMKEAVAQVVHALSPTAFSMENNYDRDGWELFAADFVIDEDYDVWLMSAHDNIVLHEDVYSNLELGHDLYTGMIRILEEVWTKQEQQQGRAPVPILPLEAPGRWELLYVSDVDRERNYMYNYAQYDRRKSLRKKKKECAKVRKNIGASLSMVLGQE